VLTFSAGGREKIVTRRTNAETKRTVGVRLRTAARAVSRLALMPLLLASLGIGFAQGQRGGHAGAPHGGRPSAQERGVPRRAPSARPNQSRQRPPRGNQVPAEPGRRNRQDGVRPAYSPPGRDAGQPADPRFAAPPPRGEYPGAPGERPGGPSPAPSYAFPPGHLGSWLNQHRNLPLQGQERLLHSDPNFNHLPQAQQQRLVQQLRQVDQLPPQQRELRLARAEAIEHMTPQERSQLYQSSRELSSMPPDRRTLVKRAFRDLRGVPVDQRQTVINSQRYQSQFSPQERDILTNLLRAEPYQPPHP
jgi:hypothetical protein